MPSESHAHHLLHGSRTTCYAPRGANGVLLSPPVLVIRGGPRHRAHIAQLTLRFPQLLQQ